MAKDSRNDVLDVGQAQDGDRELALHVAGHRLGSVTSSYLAEVIAKETSPTQCSRFSTSHCSRTNAASRAWPA